MPSVQPATTALLTSNVMSLAGVPAAWKTFRITSLIGVNVRAIVEHAAV